MDTGLTSAGAEDLLAELASTYTYVQLHVGLPGASGAANVADESTRLQVTWASPSAGTLASASSLEWEDVAADETFTHFSAWSAASDGTCGFTGTVIPTSVEAGDTFKISAGNVTASLLVVT